LSKTNRPAIYRRGLSTSACALLFVAIGLLQTASRAQDSSRPLPEEWFDDDEWHLLVQYIITADELATYHQSKTEKDRGDFISRFWARRDPAPGTAHNEFRDEFDRRVDYANAHFTDPANAPHTGLETDRGRIYVMFGAPESIDRFPGGAYEIWRYAAASGASAAFRLEFSVPPIHSCDGSYRILSPPPVASFKGISTSVQVYPQGFITAAIPVDFSQAASVAHKLRMRNGSPVAGEYAPIFESQLGPAGNDPMSQHLLGCRMFETGGMGFTHPLPPGSYMFSSTVTLTSGQVQNDSVTFEVK